MVERASAQLCLWEGEETRPRCGDGEREGGTGRSGPANWTVPTSPGHTHSPAHSPCVSKSM